MNSKNLLLLVVMSFILGSVNATFAYTYAASTPYCAAPGELTLGIEDQSSVSAAIEFDSISTYYNSDYESVPLMVKNGDGTQNFKFSSYINTLEGVITKACTGTAVFNFIDLVGSYLFLYDSASSAYKICIYDITSDTISPVTLVTSSLVSGTISQFDPYLTDGTTLYVLVGDGTVSQVVSFNAATGAATKVGNPITGGGLLSAGGNDVFLYDETDKVFLAYSNSAWAAESVIGSVSGKLVKVTGLRQANLIVDVMASNKLSSKLYSVSGSTATQVTTIALSTFEVMDFSDGVNDFVHITSSEMTWLTLPNQDSATLYKSTVPASVNTELSSIVNVGLSGNKAVILYSSNRLEYLKHTGADAITVLFSRSYNSGEIAQTGDKQYKLSIKCMCAGVNRLACFSATLNCVIIRKAGVECHSGTDTGSDSW